jgi:D-inositol-3-phosphate glycosyltransferase
VKICFVSDSYPPNIGGAEIVIKNIVDGVAARGINTTVITTYPNDKLKTDDKLNELNIIRFKVPKYMKRFWFLLFSLPIILRNAKDADIIHGTTYGGALPSFIAAKILKKRVVLTVHEFMGKNWFKLTNNSFNASFYYLAELILARLSFIKFVAVSLYTKERLIEFKIPEEKISLIHNGESFSKLNFTKTSKEVRRELEISESDIVFSAYGRAGISKGFEFLIDAIPSVLEDIPNSKFLLILTRDDKKLWKRITSKIQNYDRKRVIFLETQERDNLFTYLNASDVIIIPSLSEGFGYTTLEASKLNKPVIASNVGAIPEVVSGNYILIEPGSSEAIINGCLKAVKNEFLYKQPIIFNWKNSVKSYVDLYKEIINLSI